MIFKPQFQPRRGSCFFFFLNRAAVGWAVSCSAFGILFNRAAAGVRGSSFTRGFFFPFVGELTKTSARPNAGRDI